MNIRNSNAYWYLKRKGRKSNITHGSPAQYGQDQAAFELLGNPKQGVFLDIGANDGTTFSNSLLFEQAGWEGVCIEPNPIIFKTLEKRRSCHCVNACITDSDGTVDFLAVDGPAHMLSGIEAFLDERHLERIDRDIAKSGGSKELIQVEAITPATLLKRFDYDKADFLSLDTEGCELPILKHFDLKQIQIGVISVENGSRTPEIFNHLTSVGYRLVKCVGCDEIYQKLH